MIGVKKEFNFNPLEWKTPNTYNRNFQNPPFKSGVYLLVSTTFTPIDNKGRNKTKHEILYVGSAKNLNVRYARHEVKRVLQKFYDYIQFYFIEETNYREVEKELIKLIQPKFNKQWR